MRQCLVIFMMTKKEAEKQIAFLEKKLPHWKECHARVADNPAISTIAKIVSKKSIDDSEKELNRLKALLPLLK